MPAAYDLNVRTNETLQFSAVWQQTIAGVTSLVTILSWNARLQVRSFLESPIALIDVGTTALGLTGISINGLTSTITVTITTDLLTALGPGNYVYDLIAFDPVSDYTYPLMSGAFNITAGITAADYSSTSGGTTGGGSTTSLTPTGVTAGTYNMADVTVDVFGRIFAASAGSLPAISGLAGGTYDMANVTVGTNGLITAITNGGLPSISGLEGSYTLSNLTINAQGIITSASSGAGLVPGDNIEAADSTVIINATAKTGTFVSITCPQFTYSGDIAVQFGTSSSGALNFNYWNDTVANTMLAVKNTGVFCTQIREATSLQTPLTGSVIFDLGQFSVLYGTPVAGASINITFINYVAGFTGRATLIITNAISAHAISYGSSGMSVKWEGGSAPSFDPLGGTDILTFFTADGTNWFGSLVGRGFA